MCMMLIARPFAVRQIIVVSELPCIAYGAGVKVQEKPAT